MHSAAHSPAYAHRCDYIYYALTTYDRSNDTPKTFSHKVGFKAVSNELRESAGTVGLGRQCTQAHPLLAG